MIKIKEIKEIERMYEIILRDNPYCQNCLFRHKNENRYYCFFASKCVTKEYEFFKNTFDEVDGDEDDE